MDLIISCLFVTELQAGSILVKGVKNNSSFRFQEETCTEIMLADTHLQYSNILSIETYSKRFEKSVGADWMWTFKFNNVFSTVLVQAKKMIEPCAKSGKHHVKINGRQKYNLLRRANSLGIPAGYIIYLPSSQYQCPQGKHVDSSVYFSRATHLKSIRYSESDLLSSSTVAPIKCLLSSPNAYVNANLFGDTFDVNIFSNEMGSLAKRAREYPQIRGHISISIDRHLDVAVGLVND